MARDEKVFRSVVDVAQTLTPSYPVYCLRPHLLRRNARKFMTLFPGTVIAARPVGVLYLEDEAGTDEKILAVPTTKISPYYKDVENYTDLPRIVVEQIEHFFTHYKDLEAEKWVRVGKWGDAEAARKVVLDSIEMAKAEKVPA